MYKLDVYYYVTLVGSSFIKTIEFNSYEDAVKYIKDYEQTLGNRYRDRYTFKGHFRRK